MILFGLAIGLAAIAACDGATESDTEVIDTDVDLASLPDGIFFEVDGRGFTYDADWGPAGAAPPTCQRVPGGMQLSGKGPLTGSGGRQDSLSLLVCGVAVGGPPTTIRAGIPFIEDNFESCYPTPMWGGTFSDRERIMYVKTFPPDAAESERTCRLRALVTDEEVALTFGCPSWRTWHAAEEERGEPVAISGTVRCPLVDAP